ncbi:MAG: Adenine DNA glycosylase [Chlamydiae bacterium]|nr:Adenine DNA glycosylase [Chlamydiota bacterium]
MSQTPNLPHWKVFEELREWFLANRRPLPWRENPTPYRVWISEVMLQQTQVKTVIPYFHRWMEVFPTVHALAEAPLEQVIKLWEGLGYYSRARNLHEAAKMVVAEHGGELPADPVKLSKIKGLGPYTIGAILNFAFHQRAPAVDGNVSRVLARFFGGKEVQIDQILPKREPWVISEALIELGALICHREPACQSCPLQQECEANRLGMQKELPRKKKRAKATLLYRTVGVIRCGESYLLKKGEKGKIMADLFEFPFVEAKVEPEHAKEKLEKLLKLSLKYVGSLSCQHHTFTRYRAHLYPYLFEAEEKSENHLWKTIQELSPLPFSSGHRKILKQLLIHENITH